MLIKQRLLAETDLQGVERFFVRHMLLQMHLEVEELLLWCVFPALVSFQRRFVENFLAAILILIVPSRRGL